MTDEKKHKERKREKWIREKERKKYEERERRMEIKESDKNLKDGDAWMKDQYLLILRC